MVHFDAKLTGSVEDVSLADLLQLFHYARKSVTLHISGTRGGSVVMVDGEISHAECAGQQGEEALASLLAQKLVRVRTCAAMAQAPRTVNRTFGAVVLDLLRQNDEHERDTLDLLIPEQALEQEVMAALELRLNEWLRERPDVEHGAVIDPRQHCVLACDSPALWSRLVQSLLIQTLVAPYFDDSFDEIDEILPSIGDDRDDRQTVVTFGGRRYVLGFIPEHGWVAALVFRTTTVTHGLSLTHMVALRQAIRAWATDALREVTVEASEPRVPALLWARAGSSPD